MLRFGRLLVAAALITTASSCAPRSNKTHFDRWADETKKRHAVEAEEKAEEDRKAAEKAASAGGAAAMSSGQAGSAAAAASSAGASSGAASGAKPTERRSTPP